MSKSAYASDSPVRQSVMTTDLRKLKQQGEKIAMLTAYDASFIVIEAYVAAVKQQRFAGEEHSFH